MRGYQVIADVQRGQNPGEGRVAGVQEPAHQLDPVRFAEVVPGAGGGVLGSLEPDHPRKRRVIDDISVEPDWTVRALSFRSASACLAHVVLAATRGSRQVAVQAARRVEVGRWPGWRRSTG